MAPAEVSKTDIVKVVESASRPVLGVIGLALIIVVVLVGFKSIRSNLPASAPVLSLPRGDSMPTIALQPAMPMPVVPTNTMRARVNSTIEQQPDAAGAARSAHG